MAKQKNVVGSLVNWWQEHIVTNDDVRFDGMRLNEIAFEGRDDRRLCWGKIKKDEKKLQIGFSNSKRERADDPSMKWQCKMHRQPTDSDRHGILSIAYPFLWRCNFNFSSCWHSVSGNPSARYDGIDNQSENLKKIIITRFYKGIIRGKTLNAFAFWLDLRSTNDWLMNYITSANYLRLFIYLFIYANYIFKQMNYLHDITRSRKTKNGRPRDVWITWIRKL